MNATVAARQPVTWHYWAISGLSLLWNSFGAYDYTMSKLDPAAYFAAMGLSPETLAYMEAMPSWLTIFWALGVWGSFAGSVLLLLRSRHAVTAFWVSLLGLAVSQAWQLSAGGMPAEMTAPPMLLMTVLIWAGVIFFIWYSRRALAKGYLR
ncbi:hypothetical protein [Novosphingobium sp. TH158]|uniref:hypothetical protein n=1 Tax=Novosphingobium sp. TH158 TaxID=2067455 RepID=UPI000C7AD3DA|nr:hypothetical protein [Novosphingobium sp. TH158]PLK26362.1 hypothetical protein C0V78_05320 [Novosphingobium sp. TH158]